MAQALWLINIDVTGLCNKTCNYCPRSKGYPNVNEHMPYEMFDRFITYLDKRLYNGWICWSGRGENSLHPRAEDMINRLHTPWRKYKTRILTNGYKFDKRKHWFALFDKAVINTYESKEEMERRKAILPAKDHRYWDQTVEPEEWEVTALQVQNRSDIYNNVIATDKTLKQPCVLPMTKAWIHWDGSIQLCCNDWTDTNVYGNIDKDDFIDVWMNNPELNKIREDLFQGNRHKHTVCSICNRTHNQYDNRRYKKLWTLRNLNKN